jgi:seryl-tRNA synthetase
MKTTQQRLEDRIKLLEEELELNRHEHTRNLQHERDRCNEEIARLKEEHASLMNALIERNMAQTKEIGTLQSLITTLRAELTTQRKELQDAYVAVPCGLWPEACVLTVRGCVRVWCCVGTKHRCAR